MKIVLSCTSAACLALMIGASTAAAHSGGPLDSNGCHADRRLGNYHCHNGVAAGLKFASRGEADDAIRTGNLPPRPEHKEGFFARLWPFGRDKKEAAAATPDDAPPATEPPVEAPAPAAVAPSPPAPAAVAPSPPAPAAVAPAPPAARPAAAVAEPPVKPSAPPPPAVDSRVRTRQVEFEERLEVLRGLHEKGVISDEEYESRRKAILDEL